MNLDDTHHFTVLVPQDFWAGTRTYIKRTFPSSEYISRNLTQIEPGRGPGTRLFNAQAQESGIFTRFSPVLKYFLWVVICSDAGSNRHVSSRI